MILEPFDPVRNGFELFAEDLEKYLPVFGLELLKGASFNQDLHYLTELYLGRLGVGGQLVDCVSKKASLFFSDHPD